MKYFRGYEWAAVLAPLLKLLEALMQLFVPLVLADIVQELQQSQQLMLSAVWRLLALTLFGFIGAFIGQYFSAKAAIGYTQQLNAALFDKVFHLKFVDWQSFLETGVRTRLQQDLQQIQQGLNFFFRLFLRSPFIVLGACVMLWRLNTTIGIVAIVAVILMYSGVAFVMWRLNHHHHHLSNVLEQLVRQSIQWIEGIFIIRSLNQQDRVLADYQAVGQQYAKQQQYIGGLEAVNLTFLYAMVNGLTLAILMIARCDRLTSSVVVASVNYCILILEELFKSTYVLTQMSKGWVSWQRVNQLLNVEDAQARHTSEAKSFDTFYKVEQLQMSYPEQLQLTLESIDLVIEKGKWYGITGPTGSGKSTLLQVLAGVLPFQSGIVDEALFEQSIWVPQQAMIWQGTVQSNLVIDHVDVSEDELWNVLKIVQLADIVRQHPQQLLMPISAFGRQLSGGQKQRLMITRALLQQRPILLLDDATSALDYQTEQRLLQAIKINKPDLTVIYVSQRPQVLQQMDRLYVMEAGRIVSVGTWEQLSEQAYIQALAQETSVVKEAYGE